jgi:hypothetical protein
MVERKIVHYWSDGKYLCEGVFDPKDGITVRGPKVTCYECAYALLQWWDSHELLSDNEVARGDKDYDSLQKS